MHRPTFTVAAWTITTIAAFGLLTRFASRFLPEPPLNALQFETAEFLRQASRQEVAWRTLGPQAFHEAKRANKPVMLVVGAPWSTTGREVDRQLFADPDVAAYLNRAVVCVRVDAQRSPAWLGAILPLSRPLTGMPPGLQIWFLTPDGIPFDYSAVALARSPFDPNLFLSQLFREVEEFRSKESASLHESELSVRHKSDVAALTEPRVPALPDFGAQDRVLEALAESPIGGFPIRSRAFPRGSAFRYLLLRGRSDLFAKAMDPLLQTSFVDWIDGGFFAAITPGTAAPVEFDKIAVQNAELMEALAWAGALFQSAVYTELAKLAFDSLAHEFQFGGLIAACRVGDSGGRGRSAWSSFSPLLMRQALEPRERDWLRKHFRMRVEENPSMALAARDPAFALAHRQRLRPILAKLQKLKKERPTYAGMDILDVNGYVAARMVNCARIWDDPGRLAQALSLVEKLEVFRAADDVIHTLDRESTEAACLADYLGYADAALAAYCATGRTATLMNGLRVLERARSLFRADTGVWNMTYRPPPQPGPQDVQAPEALDFVRESSSAQAIRLLNDYGRLVGRPDLVRDAERFALALGPLSDRLAYFGSGYFAASLSLLDDAHAIAVGPRALEWVRQMSRAAPTRLVAPVSGHVRPELLSSPPGLYVVKDRAVSGPLSLEEAINMLPATYRR